MDLSCSLVIYQKIPKINILMLIESILSITYISFEIRNHYPFLPEKEQKINNNMLLVLKNIFLHGVHENHITQKYCNLSIKRHLWFPLVFFWCNYVWWSTYMLFFDRFNSTQSTFLQVANTQRHFWDSNPKCWNNKCWYNSATNTAKLLSQTHQNL